MNASFRGNSLAADSTAKRRFLETGCACGVTLASNVTLLVARKTKNVMTFLKQILRFTQYVLREFFVTFEGKITKVLIRGWWGVAAVVGGCLWAVKSLMIMITGNQPDYLFELAPIALAATTLGLILTWYREFEGSHLPVGLGVLALASAGVASVSYIVRGDDDGLFGPASIITMLSIIVLLFWVGRPLWRTREGEQWRAVPYPLAWAFVVAIPLGGLLSAINERLLEIPLLAISMGWIWLGVAWLAILSGRQNCRR